MSRDADHDGGEGTASPAADGDQPRGEADHASDGRQWNGTGPADDGEPPEGGRAGSGEGGEPPEAGGTDTGEDGEPLAVGGTDTTEGGGDDSRGDDLGPLLLPPDSDAADRALDALGSESTRAVLWLLYERPRTAREVAAALDCSVQNAHYHLRKLASADLATVVGTRFPENGNHRDVFGPTADPLVLPGTEDAADDLRDSLDRLLAGGLVVVGLLAAAVGADRLTADAPSPPPSGPASVADGGGLLSTADPVVVAGVATVVALVAWVGAWRLLGRR